MNEHYTSGLTGLAFVTENKLIGAYTDNGQFKIDPELTENLFAYVDPFSTAQL